MDVIGYKEGAVWIWIHYFRVNKARMDYIFCDDYRFTQYILAIRHPPYG